MNTTTDLQDELSHLECEYMIYYDTFGNKIIDHEEFEEVCKDYEERIKEIKQKIRNSKKNE